LKKAQFIVKCLKKAISHQAYFHSAMKYSIIFWLTDSYIKNVVLKKRWYIWFLGLKDVHPAGIVLRHMRF